MTSWPLWDDEKAVSQRVSDELEKQSVDVSRVDGDDKPWRPSWDSGWTRWREQAFARARSGDFDVLTQYVAFAHLGDITLDERRVLLSIINGKIRHSKAGNRRELSPLVSDTKVNLVRLMWRAEEIRGLLVLHYGHRKGIQERAINIAGERVNWYGEPADEMREKALDGFRREKSRRTHL